MLGRLSLVFAALLLVSPQSADAVMIHFSVELDVAQSISATPGATGSGSGTVVLDTDANTLTYNVDWSGLTGTPTVVHFHGACGIGEICPAMWFLPTVPPIAEVFVMQPVTDFGADYAIEQQKQDLVDGLWYINVHTTQSGGGEIRGQILLPEPSAAWLGLGALLVGRGLFRRR